MSVHDDLAAAQNALRDLERAVGSLRGHYGSHVDVARLGEDVARVSADLALLRRSAPNVASTGPTREPVVVPDGEYDRGMWADDERDDEGLGGPNRHAP